MSYRCQLSGKSKQIGNRVSHANNKSSHTFLANIQTKRFYIPEQKKWVRVKVSARMLRTIDKIGLLGAMKKYGVTLSSLQRGPQ